MITIRTWTISHYTRCIPENVHGRINDKNIELKISKKPFLPSFYLRRTIPWLRALWMKKIQQYTQDSSLYQRSLSRDAAVAMVRRSGNHILVYKFIVTEFQSKIFVRRPSLRFVSVILQVKIVHLCLYFVLTGYPGKCRICCSMKKQLCYTHRQSRIYTTV